MIQQFYRWFHKATSRSEEADEYSAGYWQSKVRNAAFKLCQNKTGRLLEVGCGEGIFLSNFLSSDRNISIYGVDKEPRMLEKAKNRLQGKGIVDANLALSDAINLPFENSFFDVVVCINVLFNMSSLEIVRKSLKEMSRVCKNKGSVIFDFRNGSNLLLNLKYRFAPSYDPSTKSLPLMTFKLCEIESILKEMNFKIANMPYTCFPKGRFTPIILIEAKR